ncbi:MAG: hypothetical protein Kow00109_15530 [Acidobacteriota bacterium]
MTHEIGDAMRFARGTVLRRWTILAAALLAVACGAVKERRIVRVPPAYLEAREATPAQLVSLVNGRYAGIEALAVPRLEVEFTGGSIEEGYLEKYRKAGGYLAVRRPDSIFMNVLNPLTKSSVLVLAAHRGEFRVWIPSRNQFVTGSVAVPPNHENAVYNVRPDHILEGVLIRPIPVDPYHRIAVAEEQDARFKYYVLEVLRETVRGGLFLQLERRIWIERSRMELRRQILYQNGSPVSDVAYGPSILLEEKAVPLEITVKRPQEGYTVRLSFDEEGIRLNPELEERVFGLEPPPGAEIVHVEPELDEAEPGPNR